MRLKAWSRTLRWRLIWPSIVINVLAVIVTAWIANYILHRSLTNQIKERAKVVSHAVNHAAESVFRSSTLQRFVYSTGAERDVSLIIVAGDQPPRIVACTRNEFNGALLDHLPWRDATDSLQKALSENQTSTLKVRDGRDFQIATPLILSDTQATKLNLKPGAVLVRLSEVQGETEITGIVLLGTSLFVFLLIGTNALILFLIQRRVLQPLDLINETLTRRSEGDHSARAPVLSSDEIGTVANAMNHVFDRREELETEAIARAAALTESNRMLSDSEARFRIAAESTTDVIYDWDVPSGKIQWHRDIGEMLGYDRNEFSATQEAWSQAIHPEDRERVLSKLEKHMQTGEPFDIEYRLIAKDGTCQYWRDRRRALRNDDGRATRMIGVMTNVTPERIASQQLYAAKEAAENANRAKDDFLAALSHELRTPLNPVLMLAGEMERSPEVPPNLREGFALIRHNVELEASLIDDLLDLTRITRGKFHLERRSVDLYGILRKAIETVRATIEARGLTMQVELAPSEHQIDGDPIRLQQVFWNVLKNAAKFTAPGGRIIIRSQTADKITIRVSITDTGIGVAKENLERIFNAFEQIQHPSSHRFGGLGLGLAISRKLVEAHEGKIWAESSGPGLGTTFHIVLPLLSEVSLERPLVAGEPSVPAQVIPLRILLVEDHDETREVLERLLKRRGHEVIAASDVATARKLAEQHDFDLVISDIGLPDGSGYDLMAGLREIRPQILGIALSGFGMERDVQRSSEAGFFAHLTKPVDMQILDRTIANANLS